MAMSGCASYVAYFGYFIKSFSNVTIVKYISVFNTLTYLTN